MRALRFCIITGIMIVMAGIVRFSLQFIPSWKISKVTAVVDGGGTVPYSTLEILKTLYGKPLYGFFRGNLSHHLEENPLVVKASVKRKLPDTLSVRLALLEADAVIIDGSHHLYVLHQGKLVDLSLEDSALYPKEVIRVEVSDSYADLLLRYGADKPFLSALEMLATLSQETSLITSIKYDNNRNDGFGNVVLEIDSLHARLAVREKVTSSQVAKAIEVVKSDRKGTISLKGDSVRYDLYASGLVRR